MPWTRGIRITGRGVATARFTMTGPDLSESEVLRCRA